jgi:hypothetical protein
MKSIRILGLALVAVFALVAIAASSASATEPSWYECAKVEGGKYVKGCAKVAGEGEKGGYEVQPGVGSKGKETKTKGGAAALHVVIPAPKEGEKEHPSGDIQVKCEKFKGVVKPVLPKGVVKVVDTFSKCSALGAPCQSGEKKGTIVTNSLAGQLGDLDEAEGPAGVGIVLFAEAGPETPLATFTCTELATSIVFGSVIGTQEGDINTFNKETKNTFTVGPFIGSPFPGYTPLVNRTRFVGEAPGTHFLVTNITEAGSEESNNLPSGQEGVANNKGEKNVEVKD